MAPKTQQQASLRLLIVDDDELQLRTISDIMRAEGFEVLTCTTASEALRHLEARKVDVAVVDLRLPDLGEEQLLQRLSAVSEEVPIIVNTGYASFRSAKDAVNLGVFAYVEKAGDPAQLIHHVHRAVETRLQRYASALEKAVSERTRELQQANETLKQAQQQAADLAKFPSEDPNPVLRVTSAGQVLYANAATRAILLGDEATDLVRAFPTWGPIIKRALRSATQEELEEHLGGRVLSFVFAPVVAGGYVNVYGRDITERKRAEKALRQNEERFRASVENMLDCFGMYSAVRDESGRITDFKIEYVNDAACRGNHMSREQQIGKHLCELLPGHKQTSLFDDYCRVVETGRPLAKITFHYEDIYSGQVVSSAFDIRVSKLGDGFAATWRDVTDHIQAERKLAKSREALRSLAARLQVVREEERTQLARRIHDDVGQALIGLKMDLAWLGRNITKAPDQSQAAKISERLESMVEALGETIQTVRDTASDLRPGLLDDVGLAAAIAWQASQFQTRTGVKCIFLGPDEDLGLGRDQTTALFRICQELLTNIAQHAGATTVRIVLTKSEDIMTLEVSDDGKGIKGKQVASSRSLGILGMRERAHILGGDLSITGRPGKGTTATVRIPLPDAIRPQQQQQDAARRP